MPQAGPSSDWGTFAAGEPYTQDSTQAAGDLRFEDDGPQESPEPAERAGGDRAKTSWDQLGSDGAPAMPAQFQDAQRTASGFSPGSQAGLFPSPLQGFPPIPHVETASHIWRQQQADQDAQAAWPHPDQQAAAWAHQDYQTAQSAWAQQAPMSQEDSGFAGTSWLLNFLMNECV